MNILCILFHHKYKLKRKITNEISELYCERCKKEFGINKSMKALLPLDDELKRLHDYLLGGDIYAGQM